MRAAASRQRGQSGTVISRLTISKPSACGTCTASAASIPPNRAVESDFFYPALRHDPTIAQLEQHFQARGWKPAPLPIGVMRDDDKPPLSRCIRCGTCGGYPCLVSAKSDARTIAIDPLLTRANVTLLPNRKVVRLETDAAGKSVKTVHVQGPDGEETYSGDIVVLAAGAVNTAALLLASKNPGHENGLANGSDQVGRNYMFHTMSALVSVTPTRFDAPFPKTMYVNDFYWGDKPGGFDYPMGHMQLLEHMDGHVLEGQAEEEGIAPVLIPGFSFRTGGRTHAGVSVHLRGSAQSGQSRAAPWRQDLLSSTRMAIWKAISAW